jgi:hypothetical protein
MLAKIAPALVLSLGLTQVVSAQETSTENATVKVASGKLEELGANKRVALTGCMVEFETSALAQAGGGTFNRNTSTSSNVLTAVPKDVFQDATNRSCASLREKLTKAGFTVLPDAEVKASPVFAQILTLSGVEGVHGTKKGDVGTLLFADAVIPQYLPYIGEGAGISTYPGPGGAANYEKALPDAKPAPGGFAQSRKYDLPKLEVELAKSLNAHVLKAWTVVGFGGASAASDRDWTVPPDRLLVTFKGAADSLLTVVEHQTRLAIRLAGGNPKGHAGMMKRGPKLAPTDGDIVIELSAAMVGGNSFFAVDKGQKPAESGAVKLAKGFGALVGGGHERTGFFFETTISDPEAYRNTLLQSISTVHDGFVGVLSKP